MRLPCALISGVPLFQGCPFKRGAILTMHTTSNEVGINEVLYLTHQHSQSGVYLNLPSGRASEQLSFTF